MSPGELTDADYARLLEFRTSLRRFLHWSEMRAEAVGLTPAQHQLLLAIRGHDDPSGPTVRDVAASLLVRHHSVVGLVDRAQESGLVRRVRDRDDGRVVRLQLTGRGRRLLEQVSAEHLVELRRIGELIPPDVGRERRAPSTRRRASSGPR